jgi:Bacterial type II secretion system protein I/J.
VALNRAVELRLGGMNAGRRLPGEVTQGRIDWRVTVEEASTSGGMVEATILVTAPDRPGARLVTIVPREGR